MCLTESLAECSVGDPGVAEHSAWRLKGNPLNPPYLKGKVPPLKVRGGKEIHHSLPGQGCGETGVISGPSGLSDYDTGHGGNIYRASEELGVSVGGIIDFSASINPLGVPGSVITEVTKDIRSLRHYPDPDAKRLRQEIARYHDIDPESIVCGNGSTELIYLVVRALRPRAVLIPAPTFSEYERACRMSDNRVVTEYRLKKEESFDVNPDRFIKELERLAACHSSPYTSIMAFLCNPNNPTGRLLKRSDIMEIADALKMLRCYLVVDEAFVDFVPEESVIRDVGGNPHLIVIRSMTKFYALAGLRLGYGVFPPGLLKVIHQHKEPWTVNTLAQTAGITAINDNSYRDETFRIIRQEKQFMESGFKELGIDHIPSSVNYYLMRLGDAERVIASLRSRGILVRGCSSFSGLDGSYIRVAVRSRRDNARLLKELSLCLKA